MDSIVIYSFSTWSSPNHYFVLVRGDVELQNINRTSRLFKKKTRGLYTKSIVFQSSLRDAPVFELFFHSKLYDYLYRRNLYRLPLNLFLSLLYEIQRDYETHIRHQEMINSPITELEDYDL